MKAMRTIFKYIIGITLILSIAYACSEELTTTDNILSKNQESLIKTRGDVSFQDHSVSAFIKGKKVTREFVPVLLERSLDRTEFKDIDKYTITTVSKDGRELIHVANFEKGGWAIVSGRFQAENQILAYGAEGEFDPNNIKSPEVRFWLERAETMIEHGMIEDEEASDENHRSGPYDNEPYVWLRVPLGYQYPPATLLTTVNPLTVTKWGQDWPWTISLTPKDPTNNYYCPFGCTAVAYSQMLYYLHYELGVPSGLYHQIDTSFTWHFLGSYFQSNLSRSNYQSPSSNWSQMQLVKSNGMTNGTIITGRFIMDIADRINTRFRGNASTAEFENSVFAGEGISSTINDGYDQGIIINSLNDDMPVVIRAKDTSNNRSNNGNDAHAWIIDGYKKYQNSSDYQEYLKIIPTDSLSFYPNLNYDMILTDSQKQQLYPGIEEYEIIHNYTYWFTYYFNMNWGWNNDYIGYYSSVPLAWTPGSHVFSEDIDIMYGFEVN